MATDASDKRPIYLDYHATTPTDPRVAAQMWPYLTAAFGNASSTDHPYGDEADRAVSQARERVAALLDASPKEVVFTSGATESANLAIQGSLRWQASAKPRVAISPVEHNAVTDTCEALARQGQIELVKLQVDQYGRLDLEHLERTCQGGLALLCVMAANNEVGTIYPVERIAAIAHQYGIPFFCDASQAVGKVPLEFRQWDITYLAVSAHKLYGPKGIGALIVSKDSLLEPILYGGGHQWGLRSGTLNVPAIVGLGEACRLRQQEMEQDEPAIAAKRDRLQALLQESIPDLVVNGDQSHRLAGNLHVSVPGIPNDTIVARVRDRLALSTGAACSSGVEAPSHVLRAMALSESAIEGALRIGIGKFTTELEIERAAETIATAVSQVRSLLGGVPASS